MGKYLFEILTTYFTLLSNLALFSSARLFLAYAPPVGLDDLLGLGGPPIVEAAPPAPATTAFDPLANLGLGAPAAPVAPVPTAAAVPASLGNLLYVLLFCSR